MGWGGRWEGGSGWGTHVNPWLIHVNVWQKPLQYCNQPPTNKNNWEKNRKRMPGKKINKIITLTILTTQMSLKCLKHRHPADMTYIIQSPCYKKTFN